MNNPRLHIHKSRNPHSNGRRFRMRLTQGRYPSRHLRHNRVSPGKIRRDDRFVPVQNSRALTHSELYGGASHIDANNWLSHPGLDGGSGRWSRNRSQRNCRSSLAP